jgi:tagaturonate reductase
MILSKQNIINIKAQKGLTIPDLSLLSLPERVLQFGTGVLLRGLPDYFIDKANRNKIFNGRIVVVKSTDSGDANAFQAQDGLFTLCERGIDANKTVDDAIVVSSISRVLSAADEWQNILECAKNPQLQLIISNTTEVGIVLVEDDVNAAPPISFPGKLLAFLLARYTAFNGSKESGMVIVPTELIVNNATKLKAILMELAHRNKLDASFIEWMDTANDFCNSLVDRIVPGKFRAAEQSMVENKLGYQDDLMIMSESYRLWAIETGNERSKAILSFAKADAGVVIAPNITKFRELKLRLLNGSHTLACGLAFLAGFETVIQAMKDSSMSLFIKELMLNEISPCVVSDDIHESEVVEFANTVINRFCNPKVEHKWSSITLNYTEKMKMRNVPLIKRYYEQYHKAPQFISIGFAAFIVFMKAVKEENGKFYGSFNGMDYLIQDPAAGHFFHYWKSEKTASVVHEILSNEMLWGIDLTSYSAFESTVLAYVDALMTTSANAVLIELHHQKNKN